MKKIIVVSMLLLLIACVDQSVSAGSLLSRCFCCKRCKTRSLAQVESAPLTREEKGKREAAKQAFNHHMSSYGSVPKQPPPLNLNGLQAGSTSPIESQILSLTRFSTSLPMGSHMLSPTRVSISVQSRVHKGPERGSLKMLRSQRGKA